MQELLNKITEFTKDGSPTVGQWIELTDLAKKSGLKKSEMEKMVEESLAKNKEIKEDIIQEKQELTDYSKSEKFSYQRQENFERPDFTEERDSFELEMLQRRDQETKSEDNKITFNQPEVVFPELNVEFNKTEKPVEEPIIEEKEPVKEEKPIVEENPFLSEDIQFNVTVQEFPKVEQPEFTVENKNIEFEDITINEYDANKNAFETKVEDNDVLKYIIESNKKAREQAEQDMQKRNPQPKQPKPQTINQKAPKQTQANQAPKSSDKATVNHMDAKRVRNIGIAAIAAAIIFGFVGLIVGFVGFRETKKIKEAINENANLYGDEIRTNVNLAYGLSIAGMVLGGIRLLNFISDLF